MTENKTVGGIEDPRYQEAIKLLDSKEYDKALDIFAGLLEDTVAKYGELDLATAPIYYQYGSAIIEKVDFENNMTLSTAIDEDLQSAWECLEAARCIYSKDSTKKSDLAKVLLRLSDISFMTSSFPTALQDAQKALEIRLSIYNPNDKSVADAEHTVALSAFYGAKDKVSEYINKREELKYENQEENQEENTALEALLTEAKESMKLASQHYLASARIYKYIACKVAVENHLINSEVLVDDISEETINKLNTICSTLQVGKLKDELEDDLDIAKELNNKVLETENWTVEEEIEKNDLSEDEEDHDEDAEEFEDDLEDVEEFEDLEDNKRIYDGVDQFKEDGKKQH